MVNQIREYEGIPVINISSSNSRTNYKDSVPKVVKSVYLRINIPGTVSGDRFISVLTPSEVENFDGKIIHMSVISNESEKDNHFNAEVAHSNALGYYIFIDKSKVTKAFVALCLVLVESY